MCLRSFASNNTKPHHCGPKSVRVSEPKSGSRNGTKGPHDKTACRIQIKYEMWLTRLPSDMFSRTTKVLHDETAREKRRHEMRRNVATRCTSRPTKTRPRVRYTTLISELGRADIGEPWVAKLRTPTHHRETVDHIREVHEWHFSECNANVFPLASEDAVRSRLSCLSAKPWTATAHGASEVHLMAKAAQRACRGHNVSEWRNARAAFQTYSAVAVGRDADSARISSFMHGVVG